MKNYYWLMIKLCLVKLVEFNCQFVIIFSIRLMLINPLNANPEKWSNTLKQIVGNLPTICLSVFDHFMNLALKGLKTLKKIKLTIKTPERRLDVFILVSLMFKWCSL